MFPVKVGSTSAAGRFRTAVLLLSLSSALFLAQPVQTQVPPAQALQFFKNYFITGDYAVGGASLWRKGVVDGRATVQISVPGVPDGADILAAFLYVQTAETDQWSGIHHAKFNGVDLGPGSSSVAKALNWDLATAPCWSVAWPGGRRMVTYRVDVLRYLPIGSDGKQDVNGPHDLEVPDSGYALGDLDEGGSESGGGTGPRAVGASLVVVYRDPTMPFKAVVLYDGGFKKAAVATMNQTIAGFYQASTAPAAKMTHIVGDGGPLVSESVLLNGELIATNPFVGARGRKWDNPTFNGLPVPAGAASADVSVARNGLLSDCLCYSGIVFSTEVQDSDGDGLLDVWESQKSETPSSLLQDPNGQPLPILGDMGADPMHKDVFIEIGYMKTDVPTRYGGGEPKDPHSHLPTPAAIKLMGDAFKNAPVDNVDGARGIRLHVDVGAIEEYQTGDHSQYIVPAAQARGGEALDESITTAGCARVPGTSSVWSCQFSEYPGTVGWKSGFRYIRDEVIGTTDASDVPPPPANPEDDDPCDAIGSTCVKRFDANRSDMFHYAFFAHAVGMPKSLYACLNADGNEVADENGRCPAGTTENPLFFTPRTNSGIADFPGRDILVTLGAFSDVFGLPGGTDFMVASTFFHELGHNIELRHGAAQASVGGPIVPAPNCIPTYLSSMNYLYQLRGLLDDSGKPHLDFSSGIGISLNEAAGNDGEYSFKYRIGWYAPLAGSYFAYPDPAVPGGILSRTTVAGRHCDGSLMSSMDPFMVRVDARSAVGAIDWNANGRLDEYSNQDLNFNGATAELPQAFNDWANIRLNQVGAGRNVGGPFIDANGYRAFGPLSADLARADWARADWARADWARADWARADWARADWARADWGDLSQGDTVRYGLARADWARADWARADWARADWARADWGRGDDGRGDFGGGDLFVGNPDNPGGELDFETATELAKTPPNEFTATVAASGALASWKAPNIGGVTGYIVYRVPGSELGQAWQQVSGEIAEVSPGMYTLVDGAQLLNGAPYTYFAVALYADGIQSDPSNLVTITAVNKPPVADGDSYTTDEDTPLIQAAPGVLDGDADPDSNGTLTAVLVTGPSHGTLVLNANGSFTYTPAADFNGEDSFTYKATATYGPADPTVDTNIAPVTITVAPVNDAPLALSDLYTTDEDTPLTQAAPGVLANDADADSSLTAVLVNGPSHGTLTLNADGSFSYTPAANYDGEDSFTYTANDGLVDSSPATVSITVTPVNDAPVAGDDGYSTLEDTALSQAAPGVLVNDTDAESALTAILVTGPSHGTLILNANGSFTYTPVLNYSGPDAFTYKANDGTTYTGDATVSLTVTAVNDSPVAVDDGYTTTEDTALSVAAAGVLGNDTDADSTPTAVLVAGPSHGTLVLNPDGSFTYTPVLNYSGPDAFTYRANDGELDSSPATVALTVTPVNDAPAAGNDGYTTTEDTALSVAAAGVLGNDTDVDNLLAAVLVSGPAHGLLVLNANGSFTYTPAANYNGPDVFTYKAYDGTFYTDPVTVSIAVTSVNDAPTISNIADRTINANTGTGTVSFTIGDDDLATAVVSGSSSNTTLVPTANIVFGGSGANRTVTVTPAANQSGTVTITVTVTDGGGLTAVDTFVLTVKAVGYALLNVKNLPPAAGVTFKPSSTGTLVDLEWKFTTNGTVVNSADARPIVAITGPGGYSKTLSGGGANDCSNFEYKTKDNKWDVHWQPKNAAVGTYYVVVTSQKTGQRFPDSGPGFPVVFKQ